jgi:hypothetical protein
MLDVRSEHIEELRCMAQSVDVTGRPSAIHFSNFVDLYAPLFRAGFVRFVPPPRGFSRRDFFGVKPTAKGRRAINH